MEQRFYSHVVQTIAEEVLVRFGSLLPSSARITSIEPTNVSSIQPSIASRRLEERSVSRGTVPGKIVTMRRLESSFSVILRVILEIQYLAFASRRNNKR